MLTSNETKGLKDILNELTTNDIIAITDTITRRMIVVENRDEAIDVILSFSQKPSDLLRRQKITKKVLFKYIKNCKILVPADASKADFIKACLKEWQSKEIYQDSDYKDEQSDPSKEKTAQQQQIDVKENVLGTMGVEFSKWFFNLLNLLQEFGPQHFWPDCKLWVEYIHTNNDVQTYTFMNANDIVVFFNNLVAAEKYYFDANCAREAVKCVQEQHGLVKIEISGVVHQHSNCIGLFDSCFGLVRNPTQDYNWKIKVIQLKINIRNITTNRIGGSCHQILQSSA